MKGSYPKNITNTEPIFSKVSFTGEMLKDWYSGGVQQVSVSGVGLLQQTSSSSQLWWLFWKPIRIV